MLQCKLETRKTEISGTYMVNDTCIGCAICSEIAPDNFRFNHEQGCEYVCKQPGTEKEVCLCVEAMDICPVNAIEVAGET
ncbi:MAG: ferredoxin [Deltaproteobacteria bacterium]|nr:ferredoxin [Deltaproteobacteria bacterium]